MNPALLIVDDDPLIRSSLAEALSEEVFSVRTAASAEQALGMLDPDPPDIVLTDVRMPGMDGVALLRLLRERAACIRWC